MGRLVAVGSGVTVEHPGLGDEAAFLAAVHASRELHGDWVSPPSNHDEYVAYLERVRRPDHRGFLLRAGDTLVGVVNLNNIVLGSLRSAYAGYYAFAAGAGRGHMTEGLGLVVAHAFDELGLHRVEANIQPHNERSLAVVRRLGFAKEGFSPRYLFIAGQWRDHERWAVTSEVFRRPGDRLTDRGTG